MVGHIGSTLGFSQRRACHTLDQARATQRYSLRQYPLSERLTARIIELALQYGRDGYRRFTGLLQNEGWPVERSLKSDDALATLARLFAGRGEPDNSRSDNGSEFTAKEVRSWLERLGVKTLYIKPGSPWENGYNESSNSKLRDEHLRSGSVWSFRACAKTLKRTHYQHLNQQIFDTLLESQALIERWRLDYYQICPHSSLGFKPPAPVAQLAPLRSPHHARPRSLIQM